MMDKERLENMSPVGVAMDGNVLISGEDWHWLTEQAERVRELEAYLKTGTYISRKLRKENKRYREALEGIKSIAEVAEYSDEMSDIWKMLSGLLEDSK